jgi:TatD DNase family protein
MIFDTHAHYNDDQFLEDRDRVFTAFAEAGIGRVCNIASDIESIAECLDLAECYPFMYCALGIHPSDCGPMTEEVLETIREGLRHPKAVAVGEIGLDYYWDDVDREVQRYWFRRQLDLAREENKPVVIHSREAAADTMNILKEKNAGDMGGVIHCYSYSIEQAREYVKMGFFIGIGGVVTFKNSRKLKEVAGDIPLENIVLETDCPYLAPVPYRGKRNSSLYLPLVAEAIAEIRGIDASEVIAVTEKNAERLYRLA